MTVLQFCNAASPLLHIAFVTMCHYEAFLQFDVPFLIFFVFFHIAEKALQTWQILRHGKSGLTTTSRSSLTYALAPLLFMRKLLTCDVHLLPSLANAFAKPFTTAQRLAEVVRIPSVSGDAAYRQSVPFFLIFPTM